MKEVGKYHLNYWQTGVKLWVEMDHTKCRGIRLNSNLIYGYLFRTSSSVSISNFGGTLNSTIGSFSSSRLFLSSSRVFLILVLESSVLTFYKINIRYLIVRGCRLRQVTLNWKVPTFRGDSLLFQRLFLSSLFSARFHDLPSLLWTEVPDKGFLSLLLSSELISRLIFIKAVDLEKRKYSERTRN